jgi:hypothetical protein
LSVARVVTYLERVVRVVVGSDVQVHERNGGARA